MLQGEKFPSAHYAHGDPLREETGADWESKTHVDGLVLKSSIWIDGDKLRVEFK
jgi:leucyl aminopeptidase (aminopeptidase T)